MIKWITESEFTKNLKSPQFIENHCFMDLCVMSIQSEEIKLLTQSNPISNYVEFTDPGPCLRWFASSSGLFFDITSYLGDDEFSMIHVWFPKKENISWYVLKQLSLPINFVKSLRWVNASGKKAACSVFFKDERNLLVEMYRAQNVDEAKDFCKYLSNNDFGIDTFIDKPEDLSIKWVIKMENQTIGKYSTRYSAENFALKKSLSHDIPVSVIPTDISQKTRVFVNGKTNKN